MRKLSIDELVRKTVHEYKKAQKQPIIVVLDNIRSMHNVGSVFRTADAFLVEGILLSGYTPQPPHRDIHKTALGATESVDWIYFTSTIDAVQDLKKRGYNIYAIEQAEGSISLENCNLPEGKTAIVFGNEVEGVDANILPFCDGCIEIPQLGTKHSLNISVAAGIILWKLSEQRFIERKV